PGTTGASGAAGTSAGVAGAGSRQAVRAELRARIVAGAEAAAGRASAGALLPLRLPAHWGVAALLAIIGIGVGLRPQPEPDETGPSSELLAKLVTPGAGGGAATPRVAPPGAKPKPAAAPVRAVLTPVQAEMQHQLEALVPKIETPAQLKEALKRLAEARAQKTLPDDALRAIEERLKAKEKALAAAAGQSTAPTTVKPPEHGSAPVGPAAFAPISLLTPERTINPAILKDARMQYPEYESALTRYVELLARNGSN
ncbi:MAG: hypothetical protein ACREJ2_16860, partial [Planctomycetota bacterium]